MPPAAGLQPPHQHLVPHTPLNPAPRNHGNVTLPWSGLPRCHIAVVRGSSRSGHDRALFLVSVLSPKIKCDTVRELKHMYVFGLTISLNETLYVLPGHLGCREV